METNQSDANQSQHNPSTTTHRNATADHHHHRHHEINELSLEVQQHVNEEVEAANYETVYVIEVIE